MGKRRCNKDGCHAPDGFCVEQAGPEHEKCQHFEKVVAAEGSVKTAGKSAAVTSIPWTGEWLKPDQLDLLTHRGTLKIIGLIGSSGAGKTTYLAMLYSLLFNGRRIENWDFAGSYTMNGWELQAKGLQVQSDGTVRTPATTPSGSDYYSLYHFALRNDGFLHDVLFADSSGEVFSKWADNVNDPAAENAQWIYENANAFLLFVDCETIITKRGRAKRDIAQLAEQVKSGLRGRPLVIVWSKFDLAGKMLKSIVEAIKRSLSTTFPEALSLEISNYSKSELDQLCHVNNIEVAKVVLDQLVNPQPLHIAPVKVPTKDFFFLYRGDYEGK